MKCHCLNLPQTEQSLWAILVTLKNIRLNNISLLNHRWCRDVNAPKKERSRSEPEPSCSCCVWAIMVTLDSQHRAGSVLSRIELVHRQVSISILLSSFYFNAIQIKSISFYNSLNSWSEMLIWWRKKNCFKWPCHLECTSFQFT